MVSEPPLLVIAGPTASGKTELAVSLATALGGEIVSADSRQVYRGLDLGTGKDLEAYRLGGKTVPVHMIDIVDPQEVYSLYEYQRDCYRTLADIFEKRSPAILCGGSGLYLEAVLRGYRIPNVPENKTFRETFMGKSLQDLLKELRQIPEDLRKTVDVSSKKRVVRALEVADFAKRHVLKYSEPVPSFRKRRVFALNPPLEKLDAAVERHLHDRMNRGMPEEVQGLLDSGLPPERCLQLGMEYKHLCRYLTGEVSRDQMMSELLGDIRKFARRQMTYLRGMERRGVPLTWLDGPDPDFILGKVSGQSA